MLMFSTLVQTSLYSIYCCTHKGWQTSGPSIHQHVAHVIFDKDICILTVPKCRFITAYWRSTWTCCGLHSCDFGTSFDQLVLHRVNLQGPVLLQQGKCLLLVLKFILCVYVSALCMCSEIWLCMLLVVLLLVLPANICSNAAVFHSCAVLAMGKNESMPGCGRASFLNCCLGHAL